MKNIFFMIFTFRTVLHNTFYGSYGAYRSHGPYELLRLLHPFWTPCKLILDTTPRHGRRCNKAILGRVDIIWSPAFRFILYSLFLRPFGLRSVTIFEPYEKTSMPLTEPDLQISCIRLFSLTHLAPDNVKLCTILGLGNG